MIRLAQPDIRPADMARVQEVLQSGLLVQGRHVREFESAVADLVGVDHAMAVSNCTCALQLSLLALGVGRGDAVVVGAYSWPASGNAVALVGATPLFADIDPATFNLDPHRLAATLRAAAARGLRVKAVMPIHTFGLMADMAAISEICHEAAVPIVEDAACAIGATIRGRQAGGWGAMGCFSFHPRKAITTGEGGMVVTNDPDLARQVRMLRNHGLDPNAATPDFVAPGFNMRLTEFQAALGTAQLARLDELIAQRRMQAEVYGAAFSGSAITTPAAPDGYGHVYQSYVVLLPNDRRHRRAQIMASLRDEGIETAIGTYLMPRTTYFQSTAMLPGDFPVGTEVFERAMALPLHSALTRADQLRVADRLLTHVRS